MGKVTATYSSNFSLTLWREVTDVHPLSLPSSCGFLGVFFLAEGDFKLRVCGLGTMQPPQPPSTVEWGRSGPRQTVTSLTTSRKEASTGFRDRNARAGILEPPDALLAEDP